MTWTTFWDMHSGGDSKEPQELIYIEASQEEAEIIFYNRFGHNPYRVSCTCCGEDYNIDESPTLDEASKFHRKDQSIEEYTAGNRVLVIPASEIHSDERIGTLPKQGYVWID